jgi:hypothetical protein
MSQHNFGCVINAGVIYDHATDVMFLLSHALTSHFTTCTCRTCHVVKPYMRKTFVIGEPGGGPTQFKESRKGRRRWRWPRAAVARKKCASTAFGGSKARRRQGGGSGVERCIPVGFIGASARHAIKHLLITHPLFFSSPALGNWYSKALHRKGAVRIRCRNAMGRPPVRLDVDATVFPRPTSPSPALKFPYRTVMQAAAAQKRGTNQPPHSHELTL